MATYRLHKRSNGRYTITAELGTKKNRQMRLYQKEVLRHDVPSVVARFGEQIHARRMFLRNIQGTASEQEVPQ